MYDGSECAAAMRCEFLRVDVGEVPSGWFDVESVLELRCGLVCRRCTLGATHLEKVVVIVIYTYL